MIRQFLRQISLYLRPNATHITDGVFVGNSLSARLQSNNFDTIISVADGIEYSTTTESFDLFTDQRVFDRDTEFATAVDTVRDTLNESGQTLVHCREGRERAPSVVATALALEEDLTFDDAVAQIEEARPFVDPTTALQELAEEYLSAPSEHFS